MDTRTRLIQVAGRLFAERGYDGVSVRDIVSAAKVNLGAVTYHFGSKQALFSKIIDEKTDPLRRFGQEIETSRGDPAGKLVDILTEYAQFVLHREPFLKAYFIELLQGGRRLPRFARQRLAWRNRVVGDILREGIRRGIFRRCDVENVTLVFFGLTMPYILELPSVKRRYRMGPYPAAAVRRITKVALDVFMNGIRRKGRRAGNRTGKRERKKS